MEIEACHLALAQEMATQTDEGSTEVDREFAGTLGGYATTFTLRPSPDLGSNRVAHRSLNFNGFVSRERFAGPFC